MSPSLKQKILVTGGAGYVGSMVVRQLLSAGYEVVCADHLKSGGKSLLEVWSKPGFLLEKVDLTEFEQVDQVLSRHRFDGIVHLAAIVGDPACKLEPELAVRTNRDASRHLLEKAKELKIPRFIFASTCSNYGKMSDPESFVDENSPLSPVSLYAELKVGFETDLLKADRRPDFFPTALRFATVFGVSPRMRFDLTVNEFAKEVALGRELVIFGEQFWRPYCSVVDISRAILGVLQAPRDQIAYQVFNVGDTSQNYTKKMLAEAILTLVPKAQIKYVERKEDPRDYRVNFNKIKNELGFLISQRVPDALSEILRGVKLGIFDDADSPQYYNVTPNSPTQEPTTKTKRQTNEKRPLLAPEESA